MFSPSKVRRAIRREVDRRKRAHKGRTAHAKSVIATLSNPHARRIAAEATEGLNMKEAAKLLLA